MTKILGKDDLLSGESLKRELIPVPKMNASIWMREMSAEHVVEFKRCVDQFKADGVKETTLEQDIEIMSAVISFSACDENGNLLFAAKEDAKGLTRNNINLLMDLGNKALTLSNVMVAGAGLTSEVAADLKNDMTKSSLENSRKSSRKRAKKS